MNDTIITILLSFTVLLLLVALFNEYYQWRVGVCCMPTVPKVREEIIKLIQEYGSDQHKNIVELGCGWGGLAIAAAKSNPDKHITGVELSLFPYIFSKLRIKPSNTSIVHKNIYNFNLAESDIVLCYLSNSHMKNLEEKMTSELKSGSIVISSTFVFAKKQPHKIITLSGIYETKIYIYLF